MKRVVLLLCLLIGLAAAGKDKGSDGGSSKASSDGGSGGGSSCFQKGQKLEINSDAANNTRPATILSVGSQLTVLADGFPQHSAQQLDPTSLLIHPAGYADQNPHIWVEPPNGDWTRFTNQTVNASQCLYFYWPEYLALNQFTTVPFSCFTKEQVGKTQDFFKLGTNLTEAAKAKRKGSRSFKANEMLEVYNPYLKSAAAAKILSVTDDKQLCIAEEGAEPQYNRFYPSNDPDIHPIGWAVQKHVDFTVHPPDVDLDPEIGFPWPSYLINNKQTEADFSEFTKLQQDGAVKLSTYASVATGFRQKLIDAGWKSGLYLEYEDHKFIPGRICPAKVGEIDKHGFVRLEVLESDETTRQKEFSTSASLHPIGYSEQVKSKFTCIPKGYQPKDGSGFNWNDYLKSVKGSPVPYKLFTLKEQTGTAVDYDTFQGDKKRISSNTAQAKGFPAGSRIELWDNDLSQFLPTTVTGSDSGGILALHPDGWSNAWDQNLSPFNKNIRPVGYADANGFTILPPPDYAAQLAGGKFVWADYLKSVGAKAAPDSAFTKDQKAKVTLLQLGSLNANTMRV